MRYAALFFVAMATFCNASTAETQAKPDFRTRWFARPIWRQYTLFYPKAKLYFSESSTGVCNFTLSRYNEAFDAPFASDTYHQLLSRCYRHEACILENASKDNLANFQSANVMLGLMPTLLSAIAPSIAEISLLSSHRPFLAFLISMGAPGTWPIRILTYQTAASAVFGEADNGLKTWMMTGTRPSIGVVVSMGQYAAVLAAVTNIIMTSIELGQRTILSWGCTTQFLPLVWALTSSVVHVTAVIGYSLAKSDAVARQLRDAHGPSEQSATAFVFKNWFTEPSASVGDDGSRVLTHGKTATRLIYHLLAKEFAICVNRRCVCLRVNRKPSILATLITLVAGGLAFFHVVFGIMIFSSLQLVSNWDVVNGILWRYVLSTAICRIVLIIELAGIRTHDDHLDRSPNSSQLGTERDKPGGPNEAQPVESKSDAVPDPTGLLILQQ